MSQLDLTNIGSGAINTPAAGVTSLYVDSASKVLVQKNDAGLIIPLTNNIFNSSIATQSPAAAVRTYVLSSQITIPFGKLKLGTTFEWIINLSKTAAGTAASTWDVAVGTFGTTTDPARLSFTKPAGTAAVDAAQVKIVATCRGPLSTTGFFFGTFNLVHNLSATGFATIPSVVVNNLSASFDVTVPNLIVGVCITTGTLEVVTIESVHARCFNI